MSDTPTPAPWRLGLASCMNICGPDGHIIGSTNSSADAKLIVSLRNRVCDRDGDTPITDRLREEDNGDTRPILDACERMELELNKYKRIVVSYLPNKPIGSKT